MKFFNCLLNYQKEKEYPEEEKLSYDNTKDGYNKYIREKLILKIISLINYDIDYKDNIAKGELNSRVDDFLWNLKINLKNRELPILFQNSKNLLQLDKVKEIINSKLHIDNIEILLKVIEKFDTEEIL